ncbi:MAG: elongation factor Ts, partial [Mollicutes bacterium]|nr:elongation factor Ts [Mollicutes bacterium]
LVNTILNTLINSNIKTVEEALELETKDGKVNDLIIAKTSKIGEKISLRRFEIINKNDDEVFGSYIHMGGKIAVLTVLKNTSEEVAKDVAMHVAAMRPSYIRREDIPSDVIEKERAILKEQAINEGKPAEIAEKMVEGRLQKYYKEVCLEEQEFIKDSDINVGTYVKNNGGTIITMIRYEVGEGMEKREENFAEEVAKQLKN